MKSQPTGAARCSVLGAERLPAQAGSAEEMCAEVARATAGMDVNVLVTVVSANELSAKITKQGRVLPELRYAKSDRPLSRPSVGRFARSIAEAAGK